MTDSSFSRFEHLRKKLHENKQKQERDTRVDVEELTKCPYCGCPKIVFDYRNGQVVCTQCGSIIAERIPDITRPEYRVYTPEEAEEKERLYKTDIKYPNQGLGQDEIDIAKVSQNTKMRSVLERISIIHQRLRVTSTERNVVTLHRYVKSVIQKLGLPHSLLDDVIHMYRHIAKAVKEGKIPERKKRMYRLRELAAALLYIACKNRGLGFRIKEILEEFDIDRRRLARILTEIRPALTNIGIPIQTSVINETEIRRYIATVLEKLNIPSELRPSIMKLAWNIIDACRRTRLTNGKNKYAITAAAIYISVNVINAKRKQKEVANATGSSDVTIRQRYQEILNKLEIIVQV